MSTNSNTPFASVGLTLKSKYNMSKRAEERALEAYPYSPTEVNLFGHKTITADGNSCDRAKYLKGYEQAEKDTIERVVAWLKIHAGDYIVNMTSSYPDAPFKAVIGGKCWEDMKKAMEGEK